MLYVITISRLAKSSVFDYEQIRNNILNNVFILDTFMVSVIISFELLDLYASIVWIVFFWQFTMLSVIVVFTLHLVSIML